jgi:hypothetical protein
MKMVKSLLLGSAAGLVAVVGAQAADLPVKAKPVEYVKICSIYGAGFFYIPGTDTCIKIGGWVRAEYPFANAGGSHSDYIAGAGGQNTRASSADFQMRARWVTSLDVRTQTEYGTVRAYTRAGFEHTTNFPGTGSYYIERGFVQFAGFTFGKSQSYFDFNAGVFSYGGGYQGGGGSATGATATLLLAYTATFGNGFTASISAEDSTYRRNALWDSATNGLALGSFPGPTGWGFNGYVTCGLSLVGTDTANSTTAAAPANTTAAVAAVGCPTGDYAASQVPDIVGSLRVDQAWGSAQIAGALHQVRANYYGNDVTGALAPAPGNLPGTAGVNGVAPPINTHPDDKWGFAVMGGLVLNLPWSKGDQFWVEGVYSQGAACYTGLCHNALYGQHVRFNGGEVAAGWALDGMFGTPSTGTGSIELTTVWSIQAALQHYWTPALRTSVFGSYAFIDFNANATYMFCASTNSPIRSATNAAPGGLAVGALAGCNPDYAVWGVGTRTIWNPVANLDLGLEVMYTKIEGRHDAGMRYNWAGGLGRPAQTYLISDQDVWSGIFRVQRNFWP